MSYSCTTKAPANAETESQYCLRESNGRGLHPNNTEKLPWYCLTPLGTEMHLKAGSVRLPQQPLNLGTTETTQTVLFVEHQRSKHSNIISSASPVLCAAFPALRQFLFQAPVLPQAPTACYHSPAVHFSFLSLRTSSSWRNQSSAS